MAASLMSIPAFAHLPTHTIIAVGVASPRAHGHAMTRILTKDTIPRESAVENPRYAVPTVSQAQNVRSDNISTTGTNTAEILSASA